MELKEIKEIELRILKHFRRFCDENDLGFILSNGTLLGAVKYEGFIPWDDDIDVMMPRKDYDRFISIYEDESRYKLFSPERNGEYKFPFAKLCDMTTVKEEENIDNGVELGLDIDIFPIDAWNDDLEEAKKQVTAINKLMRDLTFLKQRGSYSRNIIKKAVKKILLTTFKHSWKAKVNGIIAEAKACISEEPKYLGCISWCIYGEKEIIPAEVFASTAEVTFEGDKYPAPAGYDIYLRSLYGDYEQDPPIDRQKTHHRFKAYMKGNMHEGRE